MASENVDGALQAARDYTGQEDMVYDLLGDRPALQRGPGIVTDPANPSVTESLNNCQCLMYATAGGKHYVFVAENDGKGVWEVSGSLKIGDKLHIFEFSSPLK
jgi:hypothetical protein